MIRVLLAENEAMVRGALAALLSLEEDIEVAAEVERGDQVLTAALAARPDVAVLDIETGNGRDRGRRSAPGQPPLLPEPDPDHLRPPRLHEEGDGERGVGLHAQGRPRPRAGSRHP